MRCFKSASLGAAPEGQRAQVKRDHSELTNGVPDVNRAFSAQYFDLFNGRCPRL